MASRIDDMEEEQRQFAKVINAFNNYEQYSLSANNRRRKDIYTLPREDQELLDGLGYKHKLDVVDKAILANAAFLSNIVEDTEIFDDLEQLGDHETEDDQEAITSSVNVDHQHASHSHSHSHSHGAHTHSSHGGHAGRPKKDKPTDFDMDKLRSTLKQFVRDWSEEGKSERDACYEPMKAALLSHFSNIAADERKNLRVLVPGAGLGRLAFDIAKLGFSCQGNEFSHFMLLSSFFILNKTNVAKAHTIYPYIHSFSNAPNKSSILQGISIPDVLPSLPPGSKFSLVAGDFEEIYGIESNPNEPETGQWDAIMTCFFIDTAKNIVNYLRIIHRNLAPGGVWINLGPLLWHWENNTSSDPSIELDMEELKSLIRAIGFEISNEETIETTYTSNAKSMLGYVYRGAFWTATKTLDRWVTRRNEPVVSV